MEMITSIDFDFEYASKQINKIQKEYIEENRNVLKQQKEEAKKKSNEST